MWAVCRGVAYSHKVSDDLLEQRAFFRYHKKTFGDTDE